MLIAKIIVAYLILGILYRIASGIVTGINWGYNGRPLFFFPAMHLFGNDNDRDDPFMIALGVIVWLPALVFDLLMAGVALPFVTVYLIVILLRR